MTRRLSHHTFFMDFIWWSVCGQHTWQVYTVRFSPRFEWQEACLSVCVNNVGLVHYSQQRSKHTGPHRMAPASECLNQNKSAFTAGFLEMLLSSSITRTKSVSAEWLEECVRYVGLLSAHLHVSAKAAGKRIKRMNAKIHLGLLWGATVLSEGDFFKPRYLPSVLSMTLMFSL